MKQSATSLNLLTIMNGWNGLKRKEITKFILIISNYNEVDELLAKWLVEQFLLVIKRIISINFKNHSKLSPLLWRTICSYLNETKMKMDPLLFARWTLLLLETAEKIVNRSKQFLTYCKNVLFLSIKKSLYCY